VTAYEAGERNALDLATSYLDAMRWSTRAVQATTAAPR